MAVFGIAAVVLAALVLVVVGGGSLISALSGVRGLFEREAAELAAAEPMASATRPLAAGELAALPPLVRRHLEVSGYAAAPRVTSLHAVWRGRMNIGGRWFPLWSEQWNSVAQGARLWYGRIEILPFLWAEGRHSFKNGQASMLVKLGPITLVDVSGPELAQADMITFFNDLAIFAPSSLVHPGVRWEAAHGDSQEAVFSLAGTEARATLSYDPDGMLVNFIAPNRGKLVEGRFEPARWATPLTGWRERAGLREATDGFALYYGPGGTEAYLQIQDPGMTVVYNTLNGQAAAKENQNG